MSRIDISVQLHEHPTNEDIFMSIKLDGLREEETHRVIDLHSESIGLYCTSEKYILHTMNARKLTALQLTDAIMKALAKNDLVDGCEKASND